MSRGVPEALCEFVRLFNRRAFWESHEALEGPWRESGSAFYHGLILYVSAFVHLQRDNAHGVHAQLGKALDALEDLPDGYLGVDLAQIRAHARRSRAAVAGGEGAGGWREAVGPPRLELDPSRLRGDEPEAGDPPGPG